MASAIPLKSETRIGNSRPAAATAGRRIARSRQASRESESLVGRIAEFGIFEFGILVPQINYLISFNYLLALSLFPECPLKVLVGENSPNLCPTIFSVT